MVHSVMSTWLTQRTFIDDGGTCRDEMNMGVLEQQAVEQQGRTHAQQGEEK